jgi:hypothetical protein
MSTVVELCIGAVLDMSAPTALKPFDPVCVLVKLCVHTLQFVIH